MDTEKSKEMPVFVCRCEEVTEEDVRKAVRAGARTLDDVKRATRAGMGLCQSKSCFTNIADLLHDELGIPLENILPFMIRIPVRPVKTGVLSD